MWLNIIKLNKKNLSPIELLVLSSIPEEGIEASSLIKNINANFNHWTAERGTIYPILHRMEKLNLLESSSTDKLFFKMTNAGTNFILNQIDAIKDQITNNFEYLDFILNSISGTNPFQFEEIIDFYKTELNRYLDKLSIVKSKSNFDWKEIKID